MFIGKTFGSLLYRQRHSLRAIKKLRDPHRDVPLDIIGVHLDLLALLIPSKSAHTMAQLTRPSTAVTQPHILLHAIPVHERRMDLKVPGSSNGRP